MACSGFNLLTDSPRAAESVSEKPIPDIVLEAANRIFGDRPPAAKGRLVRSLSRSRTSVPNRDANATRKGLLGAGCASARDFHACDFPESNPLCGGMRRGVSKAAVCAEPGATQTGVSDTPEETLTDAEKGHAPPKDISARQLSRRRRVAATILGRLRGPQRPHSDLLSFPAWCGGGLEREGSFGSLEGSEGRRAGGALEFLSLEAASIMRRCLELWDRWLDDRLALKLKDNLQELHVVMLVYHEPSLLWSLAGLEIMGQIEALAQRVAVLSNKCASGPLSGCAALFQGLRRASTDLSSLELLDEERDSLLGYMRQQVSALEDVKRCMQHFSGLQRKLLVLEACTAGSDFFTSSLSLEEELSGVDSGEASSPSRGQHKKFQEVFAASSRLRDLQEDCMWSADLEDVVKVLVLAIVLLRQRLFLAFGTSLNFSYAEDLVEQSLGAVGLGSLYAKVVMEADKMQGYTFMARTHARDRLYQLLTGELRDRLEHCLSTGAVAQSEGGTAGGQRGGQVREGQERTGGGVPLPPSPPPPPGGGPLPCPLGREGKGEGKEGVPGAEVLAHPERAGPEGWGGGSSGGGRDTQGNASAAQDEEGVARDRSRRGPLSGGVGGEDGWARLGRGLVELGPEEVALRVDKMRWGLRILMPLAESTAAWDDAHAGPLSSGRRSRPVLFQVQTLHYAQKEAATSLLLEVLVGLTYHVVEQERAREERAPHWDDLPTPVPSVRGTRGQVPCWEMPQKGISESSSHCAGDSSSDSSAPVPSSCAGVSIADEEGVVRPEDTGGDCVGEEDGDRGTGSTEESRKGGSGESGGAPEARREQASAHSWLEMVPQDTVQEPIGCCVPLAFQEQSCDPVRSNSRKPLQEGLQEGPAGGGERVWWLPEVDLVRSCGREHGSTEVDVCIREGSTRQLADASCSFEKATENEAETTENQAEAAGSEEEATGRQAETIGGQAETSASQGETTGSQEESTGSHAEPTGCEGETIGSQAESTGSHAEPTGCQGEATGSQTESTGSPAEPTGCEGETTGSQAETSGNEAETTGSHAGTTSSKAETNGRRAEATGNKTESTSSHEKATGSQGVATGRRAETTGSQAETVCSKAERVREGQEECGMGAGGSASLREESGRVCTTHAQGIVGSMWQTTTDGQERMGKRRHEAPDTQDKHSIGQGVSNAIDEEPSEVLNSAGKNTAGPRPQDPEKPWLGRAHVLVN